MTARWKNPLRDLLLHETEDPSAESAWELMRSGVSGIPKGMHPGSFGFGRKNHIHEGVDLYCPHGTAVHAVEPGTVVVVEPFTGSKAGSPFWNDTDAVFIEGSSGVVVYGEIRPALSVGMIVTAGQQIGTVMTVLKKDKGRPMSMLHLELLRQGSRESHGWKLGEPCPEYRLDPTAHLIDAEDWDGGCV